MSEMDYYSYGPLVHLERPLVLTGVPGTELAAIARMVAGLTGLQPLLVDRKLSHAVGHHPDRWTAEERHDARWAAERELLETAFDEGSPVVALSSQSLLRVGALSWLRERARTVYLREEPAVVFDRVVADWERDPNKHWLLARGEAPDPVRILPELALHQAVLLGCEVVLDGAGKTSHVIGNGLLDPLGLLPES